MEEEQVIAVVTVVVVAVVDEAVVMDGDDGSDYCMDRGLRCLCLL